MGGGVIFVVGCGFAVALSNNPLFGDLLGDYKQAVKSIMVGFEVMIVLTAFTLAGVLLSRFVRRIWIGRRKETFYRLLQACVVVVGVLIWKAIQR